MNEIVEGVAEFLTESSFWKETEALLDDPDVIFHESRVNTDLDPIALEYLFRRILERRRADVRNVGHAVHGELAWIKMYCVGSPVFNLVWHYQPGAVLEPYLEPFATWRHSDISAFRQNFDLRYPNADDLRDVREYLKSDHWQEQMLAKIADPEIEHFHVYVETELDPPSLEPVIREALREAGVVSYVPQFILANPGHERPGIWVGHAPDGSTSWEVAMYYTPGVVMQPAVMGQAEREYGGDGWTTDHYKARLSEFPLRRMTLTEVDAVLERLTPSYSLTSRH